MNVYRLTKGPGAERFYDDYDSYGGFVVAAHSHEEARAIIGKCAAECPARCNVRYPRDEDMPLCVWLDPGETDCELVATGAVCEAGVVLESFHAG